MAREHQLPWLEVKQVLFLIGAIVCAAISAVVTAAPSGYADARTAHAVMSVDASVARWLSGDPGNLRLTEGGISLADDPRFIGRDGRTFGVYVSPVEAAATPFDLVSASQLRGEFSAEQLELEARSSEDGLRWSSWHPIPLDSTAAALPPGLFFEYRAELNWSTGEPPLLSGVRFELASTGAAPRPARDSNPTVRLFATREGLVGRTTANGHTIVEQDKFVALPSKRALNPDGKRDYQVRIDYKGKSATAPVWDVGPWNTRDNYWDSKRDIFGDLPRFLPQSLAAWQHNHNGGRDQFNRWVTFPASIDIADGTFLDELEMKGSDWVDVTFLWLDADSPPRAVAPAVLGLKPEPRNEAAAAEGQAWFFPEGNTRPPFDTWFVVQNQNAEAAKVTFSYLGAEGPLKKQELTLEASSRVAVHANQVVPGAEFSTQIEANKPIIAERSMYFGRDGHSSPGLTSPARTWYLAEGSTQPPFDTWIFAHNPGSEAANVNVTFIFERGESQTIPLTIAAGSRAGLRANDVVPSAAFSVKVAADQPILAERATYLANGGGHGTMASPATSKTWHFAEGSTTAGFHTWVLILNPGRDAANVTITYLRVSGPPAQQKLKIGGASRAAVDARQTVPDDAFGVKIEADQAIVAERAMYFGGAADGAGTGAAATIGAPELAKTWYLADGSTQPPFLEQILVGNPNNVTANVRADFVRSDGSLASREYELPATRRLTIDVSVEVPDSGISARVTADQPIVVERTLLFNGGSGGTNALGIPR